MTPEQKYIARQIRKFDAIHATSSKAERAAMRARTLDIFPETRASFYSLAWYLDTGRASSELEALVVTMPAAKFAAIGLDIAARLDGHSVNSQVDAWKAALATVAS